MNLKTKILFQSIFILVAFGVSLQAFATWVAPIGNPPNGGNTEPPINTGLVTQAKDGGIVAWAGLRSGTVLIVDGASTLKGNVTIEQGKTLTINTETYNFPANQVANGFLKTDGAGVLTWDASGGSNVPDGDKGDITVSGSGTVWTVDDDVVTYAKLQNVAANSFLANTTGLAADVQAIATNRIPLFSSAITGTPSSTTFLRGDGSWQVPSANVSDGDKGDITVSAGGTVWNLDAGVVGNPELGANAITTDKIAVDGVTYSDLAATGLAANKILGIPNAGSGMHWKGLVAGSGITITHDVNNGNITFTANGGITDGDKGDITVSGSGTVWTVDNLSINDPKIAVGAVSNTKILDGAVGTSKIAASAVTVPKVSISGTATDEYCLTYELSLASFEWQSCSTGGLSGSGTATFIPKWTASSTLGNSIIYETAGGVIGIGAGSSPTTGTKLDVNGVLGTGDGTAIAPGHSFRSDLDTGMWRPSINTIGFSTAGVEQMRIDAIGFVSIGKTTASKMLDVNGDILVNGILAGRGGGGVSTNTTFGSTALDSNTTGSQNAAFGYNALTASTTTSNNTALGAYAAQLALGSFNTAVGRGAMYSQDSTGGSHTAIGANALVNMYGTQAGNTAVGYGTLAGISTSGGYNTALGYSANVNNGLNNATAIGYNAVASASNLMMFGGTNSADTPSSKVLDWGFGAVPASGRAFQVGVDTTNGNGAYLTDAGVWSSGSDISKKYNITNLKYGLAEIMKLRPVEFDWKGSNVHDIGFIAQEVKPIIPEIVNGEEGSMGIGYSHFAPIVVNAIQELKQENDELKARIEALEAKVK